MRRPTGFRIVAAIIFTFLLTGCGGNFYSIFQPFSTRDTSVSIDAKQRIVVIAKKEGAPANGAASMVCAEPSPDALSAMSAAMTASGSYREVSANLAASFSETASNIGVRTQTIQLLRDGMYRACEAFMNGATTPAEYAKEQRRYQILMGGLMAIEQLTGVITPKQVVLHGESAASAGTNLLQAQKNLDEARTQLKVAQKAEQSANEDVDTAQKELDSYKKTQDPAPTPERTKELEGKVTNANKVLLDKKQAVANADNTVKKMEGALEAARSLSAKTSAGGNIDSNSSVRQLGTFTPENNDKVIAVVDGIVKNMFRPDFIYECLAIYSNAGNVEKLLNTIKSDTNKASTSAINTVDAVNNFCSLILEEGGRKAPSLASQY